MTRSALAALVLALSGCGVPSGIQQSIPSPARPSWVLHLACRGEAVESFIVSAQTAARVGEVDCPDLALRLEPRAGAPEGAQTLALDCDGEELAEVSLSPGLHVHLGAVSCPDLRVRMR